MQDNIKQFMRGMLPLIDIRTVMPDNSPKIEVVSKPGMCPNCLKEKVWLNPDYPDRMHYKCSECGAEYQIKAQEVQEQVTSLIPVNQWR